MGTVYQTPVVVDKWAMPGFHYPKFIPFPFVLFFRFVEGERAQWMRVNGFTSAIFFTHRWLYLSV